MGFWSTLATDLWAAKTPFVVLAFVVTRMLVRAAPTPVPRAHLRAAATLVVGHLVALAIASAQASGGYEDQIASLASLAFQLLGYVSLGMTAMFRAVLPRFGFTLPRILIDLITGAGVLIVFIAVGNRAGFSIAGLITTSAVLTAVIGFSLQDTLSNVMGGLSVQLDKSVAVGDWITFNGQTGKVTEIRWRYTAIETRTWETVIIPNGALVKSQVIVLGKRTSPVLAWRRHIDFFVDFRTPPTEVIEAVQAALRADPVEGAAREPEPQVLFFGVKDSFANYCIRYWLADLTSDDGTDSRVRVRMWYALRRAGIPLSIPAQTLFVTAETPERATRKADDERARRMAALASVDLFRGLSESLREQLADRLAHTPFAAGESVTREGERDDGLYMIVDGSAIVTIGTNGTSREVARLVAGQFFGEMSLMTGEARTATIIATTDMSCYRVDKVAFELVLRETPQLADQIAEVLAARRSALTAVRDERDDAKRSRMQTAKQDLLGRIRGFFNMK